jgi:hypothetical protein
MKKTTLLLALCLPAITVFCQYTYKNLQVNWLVQPEELSKFSYMNLRLYPIYANDSFRTAFRNVGQYKTLKEALAAKKITVTEKGSGGTVNTLQVQNLSNDTIIILSGEIIKGGQQDRIVGEDIVLKPKSGKMDVPVYCVEAGRWHYNSPAGQKQFDSYYSTGSTSLRKVVDKEKDQSKVWSKVDELNAKNKTLTSTKTYTAMSSSTDLSKKLNEYSIFFKKAFAGNDKIIGLLAVTENKILGCDMFATHELFEKNFENLVHSYATESILNGKAVRIQPAEVKKYMDKLLVNEQQQSATLKEKGKNFIYEGKKLKVSSYD